MQSRRGAGSSSSSRTCTESMIHWHLWHVCEDCPGQLWCCADKSPWCTRIQCAETFPRGPATLHITMFARHRSAGRLRSVASSERCRRCGTIDRPPPYAASSERVAADGGGWVVCDDDGHDSGEGGRGHVTCKVYCVRPGSSLSRQTVHQLCHCIINPR